MVGVFIMLEAEKETVRGLCGTVAMFNAIAPLERLERAHSGFKGDREKHFTPSHFVKSPPKTRNNSRDTSSRAAK
jgi:hypothetical protein